jgi:Kef-type K+ transport system membrane component KefB
MGILLFATGLGVDFAVRKTNKPMYRIIAVTVVVLMFLLVWAELAVGIFGTPWSGS